MVVRRLARFGLALALVAGVAGCGSRVRDIEAIVGGGVPSSVAGPGGPTTAGTEVAGATATTGPVASAPGASPGVTSGPGATAAPQDGAPAPTTAGGATTPFTRPDAGAYTMRTTGTSQLRPIQSSPQPVDATGDTIYEHVGDADVRQRGADSGSGGGLSLVLRYLPTEVQLVSLELSGGPGLSYTFLANPPVTYARLPLTAGDSWQWELTSTGGGQRIAHSSTVRGEERLQVAGAEVIASVVETTMTLTGDLEGTIQLTSYIDPARRTSVRTQQVSNLEYQGFRIEADTTSELVSFTPG